MHDYLGGKYGYDPFLELGANVAVLPLRHAALSSTAEVTGMWADAELKMIAGGGYTGPHEFTHCIGSLRLANEMPIICRVLQAGGLTSWNAVETMNTTLPFKASFQWALPGDVAFCIHPQTVMALARMEVLLAFPAHFEAAEVFAYLPEPESSPWLKDIAVIFGMSEFLPILFGKAASGFGECNVKYII
jgi:hypothetical protein